MIGSVTPKQLIAYHDESGFSPFTHWLHKLRSFEAKAVITARLKRLEAGHYGDCKPVGDGVFELRIFHGPDYRVYFGEEGKNLVLLLHGGDKGTQKHDIQKAKEYWKDYVSMKHKNYQTLDAIEEDLLRKNPKQIEKYLTIQFQEYAEDGNIAALMSSLRVIGRVVGVSNLAEEAGLTRKGVQKVLSEGGNPRFSSINAIMHAMGYQLMPVRMESAQ